MYLITKLVALSMFVMVTGCTCISVTNYTKDGRQFNAHAWSFLWDRNLTGLKFNYEAGTLEVDGLKSNPDKETLAKGFDAITATAQALKQAL